METTPAIPPPCLVSYSADDPPVPRAAVLGALDRAREGMAEGRWSAASGLMAVIREEGELRDWLAAALPDGDPVGLTSARLALRDAVLARWPEDGPRREAVLRRLATGFDAQFRDLDGSLTVTELRELVRRALRHESEELRERAAKALEDSLTARHDTPGLEFDPASGKWVVLAPDTGRVSAAWAALVAGACASPGSMAARLRVCRRHHGDPAQCAACPVCQEDGKLRARLLALLAQERQCPTTDEMLAAELPEEPQPEPPADGKPGMWRHCANCGQRYWARTRRSAYCRAACRQRSYEERRDAGL